MSKLTSADSLEDDFYFSGSASEGEIEETKPNETTSDVEPTEEELNSKKRKLETKKAKKTKKPKKAYALTKEFSKMSSTELSEFYFEKQRDCRSQLSELELQELQFKESCFVDTREFELEHTLENLTQVLQKIIPTYKATFVRKPAKTGAPTLMIICSSAIRAVDVCRAVKNLTKTCPVGKLFAKHKKLAEQISFLKAFNFNIAIGTPNRIMKILDDSDALNLERLAICLIDCHRDQKERTIFDIPECRGDLFSLIGNHLTPLLKEDKLKLVFY
ncbi:Protein cms1 [Basidiobolus ranarum]|uniref:Protein cms1 n=1 Tax=Basidiobolus ranarum TaxID=34480 RepID=A0ABR2WBF2_9FUNG